MPEAADHRPINFRRSLFLVSLPLFFVTFALPVQSKALGASALEIGGLFSLFTFSILLMRPVIGLGIDRLGRRFFFLFAILFYIGAYLGYAVADGVNAMYVARFFQGLGAALLLITVDTMTADMVPSAERAAAMGKNVEVQTRASVVGATIGFSLVGLVPANAWSYSFALFALLGLIAFVLAFLKLPETKPERSTTSTQSFKVSPQLKRLLILFGLLGVTNALVMPIYMIYLQDNFTVDPRALSVAFLPSALVFMFLPSRFGALVDRHNPQQLLLISLAFVGCLYLTLGLTLGFWWTVVVYSASVIGWAMIEPIRKLLTSQSSEQEHYGTSFGLAEMAYGVGATAGPLIGGYLYDNVSQASPFVFSAIFIAFTALASLWLLRTRA